MKKNYKNILSLSAAIMLMGGCGSNSTQNMNDITLSENGAKVISLLAASTAEDQNNTQTQSGDYVDDSVLHIVDGDTIHLLAPEDNFDLNGTIVSYSWTDMDGIVLSETKELNRTLYYDANYDNNQDEITKYIKTITITNDAGESASKSYTIYVHKEALSGAQALLGPLAQAHYALSKLNDTNIITQGTTTQGNGTIVNSAGLISISSDILNTLEKGYYLLKVRGGKDIDRDDNLIWDQTPTINKGTIYAILTDKQLKDADYKVNILTYGVYGFLKQNGSLSTLSDAQLAQKMDDLTREIVKTDVNGDGMINYTDLLAWNPVNDKDKLSVDYIKDVLPVLNDVLSGKDVLSDTNQSKYVLDTKVEYGTLHRYIYDDHGNVITEYIDENKDGTVDDTINYTNSYDAQNHLISQNSDHSTTITRWTYNDQGVLIERTLDYLADGSPDDKYFYVNGKLDHALLDRGEVTLNITYETDQYGNVIKETVSGLGDPQVTEYTYVYDANGNVLQKSSNGNVLFEQTWKNINVAGVL